MKNFLKGLFKKNTPPTYPTADEVWDNLSESEKDDLRYFTENLWKGLKIPGDYIEKRGPSITVDGKVVAQAKPGGTIKIEKNRISVDETINLD